MLVTPYTSHHPVDDFGIYSTKLKFSARLAASTNTSLTVPGDAPRFKALIKCENGGNVFFSINQTAEVPAGASFASTTSELVGFRGFVCREVRAGDIIDFVTDTADTDVTVSFWKVL